MESLKQGRRWLMAHAWREWSQEGHVTDQKKGLPAPPAQKPAPPDAPQVALPAPEDLGLGSIALADAIRARRSRRSYNDTPLTLEELSFLLWATQGVRETRQQPAGLVTFRTVPSGGARHPFETYLVVNRVRELSPGLYRYLALEHRLALLRENPELPAALARACCRQTFMGTAAVIFAWTAVPYRTEWRYTVVAHKVVALDAGHVCQNLYLACEAIGAGTCAVGAYFQDEVDALLGVDGEDEFTLYLAPVGKVG